MYSLREMQSMGSTVFSAYASISASLMLLRSVIPAPVKSFFYAVFSRFFKGVMGRYSSTHVTMVVDEQKGFKSNEIYDAAEIYLRTILNPDAKRFHVSKTAKQKSITVSMAKDQQVTDTFQNFQLKWKLVLVVVEHQRDNGEYEYGNFSSGGRERRHLELTFDESKTQIIVDEYFPYVAAKANEIKERERAIKLYMMDFPYSDEGGAHKAASINLDHPMTFDKLAMDPVLKRCIVDDLDRFLRRRDYYKRLGKAWKRGYLLCRPPGTGKSSLIAAIANYLKFDVYELELTSCSTNSQLRRIMLCTNNRSILVVEDIDCSVQLHDRQTSTQLAMKYSSKSPNLSSQLTLSGLLNFMDGLTSSCGDERIIIFSTNHKEKLDRALLRPGRMDMHIHMGYCTPEGFDILAFNYLGIEEHERLFPVIKELIREVEITPAEIAEHLMRSEDVDVALQGVIDLLKEKKDEIIQEKEREGEEKL